MPRVKYTKERGLFQVSGQGVDLNTQVIVGNPSGSATKAQLDQPQPATLVFMYDGESGTQARTVAEHTLCAPDGSALKIPKDFAAFSGHVEIVTAVTSGGSATVTIGTGGTSNDPDGLLTSKGKALLTQYEMFEMDGALISGSGKTGERRKHKRFVTTDDEVTLTVGTAALTAGKLYVYIQGYQSPHTS
jgi:hypothetical protein